MSFNNPSASDIETLDWEPPGNTIALAAKIEYEANMDQRAEEIDNTKTMVASWLCAVTDCVYTQELRAELGSLLFTLTCAYSMVEDKKMNPDMPYDEQLTMVNSKIKNMTAKNQELHLACKCFANEA